MIMNSSSSPYHVKPLNVFIIAGEASGDILAAQAIKSLNRYYPCTFSGVGGTCMQKAGLKKSLFNMADLSVMGLFEIIPHLPRILWRMYQVIREVKRTHPDVIITVDSPGFNFVITKYLKKLSIPLVHMVAPSVWAWKPKRAEKIAKIYDHLFCLLPFEPDYFKKHGLETSFIGHPVTTLSKGKDEPKSDTILMLPGSRNSEIKRLFKYFAYAINQTNYQNVIIPTLPHLRDKIENLAKKYIKKTTRIVTENKYQAFKSANCAIAASGTVSLELAQAHTPALIAYRLSPLTYWIVKRLIKIPFVSLVNIVANRLIIPEKLQGACNTKELFTALKTTQKNRSTIINGYEEVLQTLTFRPEAIATTILKLVDKKPLRFYGRRSGKNPITPLLDQKHVITKESNWPRDKDIFLEIGFGGGEHLIAMAQKTPQALFIGSDVFAPAIASLHKAISHTNIKNIKTFNDDVRFLLPHIPEHSLSGVFILFPDPWPKKRHHCRRIITEAVLRQLSSLLKNDGFIHIASDHKDYQQWILREIEKVGDIFIQTRTNVSKRPDINTWPQTRYEIKGLNKGDHSLFFKLKLK